MKWTKRLCGASVLMAGVAVVHEYVGAYVGRTEACWHMAVVLLLCTLGSLFVEVQVVE